MRTVLFPALLFMLCTIQNCSTPNRFQSFRKPSKNPQQALLYIYRPYQTTYVIWRYRVRLYRYDGDYRTAKSPTLVKEYKIADGEFVFHRLSAGFYRIEMPDFKQTFQILHLLPGEESFHQITFYSTAFLKPAEAIIQTTSKEEAAGELLNFNRMKEHPLSDP